MTKYERPPPDLDSTPKNLVQKRKTVKHSKIVEYKFNEIRDILYTETILSENFRPKQHEEPRFRISSTHDVRVPECKRKNIVSEHFGYHFNPNSNT